MKYLGFAGAVITALVASAALAVAAPPPLFPLDQVRRGQQGYGLTTFSGTTPEKFSFEVVGVMRNFLPKMDIILVKSSDPKLAVSGFWQGMSGSPLFVDNKLMCAFSYGFRFNKVALGGCTPIQYMIDEGFVAPRGTAPGSLIGPQTTQSTSAAMATSAFSEAIAAAAINTPRHAMTATATAMANLPAQAAPAAEGYFASVPLSISGASPGAFSYLEQALAPFHVSPMRAGGSGAGGATGPTEFVLGGPIAVILIRGDMSAAATGTVSYIDGTRILAFGHPMSQTGETYAPVATAEVHGVVPSAMSAFVLASPQREVGALLQDRQSMIMADTRYRSAMIPMEIELSLPGAGDKRIVRKFNVELMQDPGMTPALAFAAATSAMELYAPDRSDTVVKIESTIFLKDMPPLTLEDWDASSEGAGDSLMAVRALRLLAPLMRNPFVKIPVTGIRVKTIIDYNTNASEIYDIRVSGGLLQPGERNWVEVLSRGKYDKLYVDRIAVDVPAHLAGAQIVMDVMPGNRAVPDVPPPTDAASLYAYLRKFGSGTTLVANLSAPAEGATVNGLVVRDLPASVADKLSPLTSTRSIQTFRGTYRTSTPAPRAMQGQASLILRVAETR